ncbi:Nuclear protein localization protein 4-like [Papilio machaon]|uniref:Nuclear protein localization protein 4-like n=1 Tax=Papilio machaon TaxID=76193 RepID=A0A194R3W0_PAPMA|nr:Nuclear protein localization protein 4-like [Papilio machaon]
MAYFQERDAYGNEVGVSARRVPVAYLLVDVPVGVARQPPAPHAPPPARSAPPPALHSLRDLHRHLEAAPSFLEAMSELHVLLYLCTNEALPLSLSCMSPLLAAVRAQDAAGAERWRAGPQPATLLQLARAAAEGEGEMSPASGAGAALWTCALCTYHNAADLRACEMCAMPSVVSCEGEARGQQHTERKLSTRCDTRRCVLFVLSLRRNATAADITHIFNVSQT